MTQKINVKLLLHPLLPCVGFWRGFKAHNPLKIKFTLKEKAHKNSFILAGNVASKEEESEQGWELPNIKKFRYKKIASLHWTPS